MRFILSFLLLIGLSACSIFDTDPDVELPEGSKPVLQMDKQLKVETEATVTLGDAEDVLAWPLVYGAAVASGKQAKLADDVAESWSVSIGSGSDRDARLLTRPISADGKIYTLDAELVLTAYNLEDGDELFSVDLVPEDTDEEAFGGGLAYEKDTLYAATGYGEVIALSAEDGTVKWRKTLNDTFRAAPAVAGGRVYAASLTSQLYALSADKGDVLWSHRGISETTSLLGGGTPVVVQDTVLAVYPSGELYALRTDTGRMIWVENLASVKRVGALPSIADIRGSPVSDGQRVYAISHAGRMVAIDIRTGNRVWEQDLAGIDTPIWVGDFIFALVNRTQLVALSRSSGRIAWLKDLPGYEDMEDQETPILWQGPVAAGNRLWLSNSNGELWGVKAGSDSEPTVLELPAEAFLAPIAVQGHIAVIGDNGELTAFK